MVANRIPPTPYSQRIHKTRYIESSASGTTISPGATIEFDVKEWWENLNIGITGNSLGSVLLNVNSSTAIPIYSGGGYSIWNQYFETVSIYNPTAYTLSYVWVAQGG